jgi:predicted metalloprotease
MKWTGRRQSTNIEDRRRMPGGKQVAFGGGLVGVIIFIVFYFLGGGDSAQLLQELQQQTTQSSDNQEISIDPAEDEMAQFVAVALADNEDVWKRIFSENGEVYKEPKLVLYRGYTQSACGNASAASGPFYCPADSKVYFDLGFFEELQTKFGASGGDFAIAYVLAHEIGHHVQNLLGTAGEVYKKQQQVSEAEANRLSVALELQADFLAGVWAHHNQKYKHVLEEGDIEEALSAASAVGDDRIQKQTQGYIVPESFTHGTSQQRMFWFKKGYQTGDIRQGNTFE